MKTTEPKVKRSYKSKKARVATEPVAAPKGGYTIQTSKPGLKEQVKGGLITAKQALTTLLKKDANAKHSKTAQWLQKRADKEGRSKEATLQEQVA